MNKTVLLGLAAVGVLIAGCGAPEPEGDPNATPSAQAAPAGVMSPPPPEGPKGDAKEGEDDPGGAGTGLPIGGVEKKGS